MGGRPAATSAALVRLNGLLPKKPLWALSGDGWADSITVCRDRSIKRLLLAGMRPPQDEHDAVWLGVDRSQHLVGEVLPPLALMRGSGSRRAR